MSAHPISVADAERALQGLGYASSDDGHWTCPSCDGHLALHVTQNGNGAHLECAAACAPEFIAGALHGELRRLEVEANKTTTIADIRTVLDLPELRRIVKHGRGGARYVFELANGREFEFEGGIDQMLKPAQFKARFIAGVRRGYVLPRGMKHEDLVAAVEGVAEELDTVDTTDDETRAWIAGCLEHTPGRLVDLADSEVRWDALRCEAFLDTNHRIHLRLTALAKYVSRQVGRRVTQPELTSRLSKLGFEGEQLAARRGKETCSRRLWVSPPGFEVER